jgi:hypothetical protein
MRRIGLMSVIALAGVNPRRAARPQAPDLDFTPHGRALVQRRKRRPPLLSCPDLIRASTFEAALPPGLDCRVKPGNGRAAGGVTRVGVLQRRRDHRIDRPGGASGTS